MTNAVLTVMMFPALLPLAAERPGRPNPGSLITVSTSAPASRPASQPGSQPKAHPKIRQMSFAAVTLEGRVIRVPQDYAGKLVLVSFWATWCPSSNRELPYWKDAYAKYHDRGVEFLGLPTDKNRNRSEQVVQEFLKNKDVTWPQAYDDAPALSSIYGVDSLPTSFLVDGDTGAVLLQGDELRKRKLDQQLNAMLEQRAPATSQPAESAPAAP